MNRSVSYPYLYNYHTLQNLGEKRNKSSAKAMKFLNNTNCDTSIINTESVEGCRDKT